MSNRAKQAVTTPSRTDRLKLVLLEPSLASAAARLKTRAQPNPNPLLRQAQETRRDKRELIEKQVRNREQENQSGIDDRSLNRKLNLDEPATELEHQPACVLKPTTRRRDNRIHWHTPREGRNSYSTSENQGTTLQTDDSMDRKQRTTDNPGEATSFHPHANVESQTRSKGKTILNFSPKADCQAPLQWSTLRRQILTHDVEHIRGEIGDDTAAKRESENSKGDPPDAGTRRHALSGPEVSKHKVDASEERRGRDKEEKQETRNNFIETLFKDLDGGLRVPSLVEPTVKVVGDLKGGDDALQERICHLFFQGPTENGQIDVHFQDLYSARTTFEQARLHLVITFSYAMRISKIFPLLQAASQHHHM
ncbi:hypothetical protein YC2023_006914 [Brassica napus]